MSRPASSSAALPIAYVVLRILIVVNWLGGAAIATLLGAMPTRRWIMSALELSPSPEAERLLPIVGAVRAGAPFVAANASRLRAIAWALLALQLLSLVIGAIAKTVSTPAHPLALDAGFSINGWLPRLPTLLPG